MSDRRLFALVVVACVGVAAAGGSRGLGWSLVLAAALAAWAAGRGGRAGALVAGVVSATAWAAAIGPWSGPLRWWLGVAIGIVVAAGAAVAGRTRRKAIAGATVAIAVLGSFSAVRQPPTTGADASTERLRALDAYVRGTVDRTAIPGAAVAVVEHGELVFARGYGVARGTRRMTADSPVVIGSTSKSITAVAVLELVEQGRLELDEPLGDVLPWLSPTDERVATITIGQLLVDTSGIPTWSGWSALAGDGRADTTSIRRLVDGIQLTSRPGERFQYSNANSIILGQVVESVTGRPYAAVAEDSVFEPLGMTHTHADDTHASAPNRYWFGVPVPSHLPYLRVGLPAGAITSSAGDLARYLRSELGSDDAPALLSPATLERSQTAAVDAKGFGVAPGRRYAMGWYVGKVAGEPAVFHSGDVFDSSSSLVLLPERGLGIAVVATTSNAVTPISRAIAEGATATMLGLPPAADLGRASSVGTLLTVVAGALVLAFAVVRARRLLANRGSWARLVVVDLALPLSILFGLPLLFGRALDRAESVSALQLWTLALRGVPDLGLLLVVGIVIRPAIAAAVVVRSAVDRLARDRSLPVVGAGVADAGSP